MKKIVMPILFIGIIGIVSGCGIITDNSEGSQSIVTASSNDITSESTVESEETIDNSYEISDWEQAYKFSELCVKFICKHVYHHYSTFI